jgi:hypothetical protein
MTFANHFIEVRMLKVEKLSLQVCVPRVRMFLLFVLQEECKQMLEGSRMEPWIHKGMVA